MLRLIALTLLGLGVVASSCTPLQEKQRSVLMAPSEELPPDLQHAAVVVRDAYRFAAANPDVLRALPCYCGCGGMGHTSSYACFVAGESADGNLRFDGHALGCSICVEIARDALLLLERGESIPTIRAHVENSYAQYGPSNLP
jgi:hypothetical protein